MAKMDNLEQVEIASPSELRQWLLEHHHQDDSIWLVTYKKNVGEKYVSREDVLDEILCFGWIDGRRKKLDEQRTMQLISPRKTQYWAKSYKDRVAKLQAEDKMHASGLESIEVAKANGLWDFMDDVDALIVPDDLEQALIAQSPAQANWNQSAPSYRRNILRWIKLAKTDKTRAKRIAKVTDFAMRNDKIPQM